MDNRKKRQRREEKAKAEHDAALEERSRKWKSTRTDAAGRGSSGGGASSRDDGYNRNRDRENRELEEAMRLSAATAAAPSPARHNDDDDLALATAQSASLVQPAFIPDLEARRAHGLDGGNAALGGRDGSHGRGATERRGNARGAGRGKGRASDAAAPSAAEEERAVLLAKRATAENLPLGPGEWQADDPQRAPESAAALPPAVAAYHRSFGEAADNGGRSAHASSSIMEDLRQLTVGELRRALQDRHIDHTGCFEKQKLLVLLARACAKAAQRWVNHEAAPTPRWLLWLANARKRLWVSLPSGREAREAAPDVALCMSLLSALRFLVRSIGDARLTRTWWSALLVVESLWFFSVLFPPHRGTLRTWCEAYKQNASLVVAAIGGFFVMAPILPKLCFWAGVLMELKRRTDP